MTENLTPYMAYVGYAFVFATVVGFLLRRIFGERDSEKFLALQVSHPRWAAAVTVVDGAAGAVVEVSKALVIMVTGKSPVAPVLEEKKLWGPMTRKNTR